ncbi:unnamed protein product [Parnassius apollo]|uniref:(apollo) hypothetical protein n=1 Tax=Parnassius apollo TaxID=110799 RepID=A0A8S3XSI8_PARAO|nr:unnamed protein product [Parnassius apollo]
MVENEIDHHTDANTLKKRKQLDVNSKQIVLHKITPLSSKWREAIEKRIEDERQLTMQAVGNGAKSNPGLFWNLSGTFLFSVYVMTALGFGAPVPHTILGRISALVYAILAVPTHIYLMWNVSTCIVVNIEQRTEKMKRKYCAQKKTIREKSDLESIKGNSNRSEKSEVFKKQTLHRYKFFVMLGIFCSDHCILLSMAIYYVFGVVGFGVLRNRTPLEIVMFPLEFTTTGGLENVTGYVRIIYGFYVEGAMCLLACLVSNIRRFSSSPVTCMLENYRLFNSSDCAECYNDEECKIIRIS